MFALARHGNRGVSAVEFALILPLFLLLILGILDFGRYYFVQHTLQYATREGMRLALVGRVLPDGHGGYLDREHSIIQKIREKAAVAVNTANLRIYIYPVASDYSDPSGWNDPHNPPNAGEPGQYMRVKTQFDYRFLTPLISRIFPNGRLTIEAQGTYKNELFDT